MIGIWGRTLWQAEWRWTWENKTWDRETSQGFQWKVQGRASGFRYIQAPIEHTVRHTTSVSHKQRKTILLLQNPALPEFPIKVNNRPTTLVRCMAFTLDTLHSPLSLYSITRPVHLTCYLNTSPSTPLIKPLLKFRFSSSPPWVFAIASWAGKQQSLEGLLFPKGWKNLEMSTLGCR